MLLTSELRLNFPQSQTTNYKVRTGKCTESSKFGFIGPRPRGGGDNKSIGWGKQIHRLNPFGGGMNPPPIPHQRRKFQGRHHGGRGGGGRRHHGGRGGEGPQHAGQLGRHRMRERKVIKQIPIRNPDHNKSSSAGTRVINEQRNPQRNLDQTGREG